MIRLAMMDGWALLTVDRPEARNALNLETLEQLDASLRELEQLESLRALVLTGAGERVFISGGDLKEFERIRGMEAARQMASRYQEVLNRLERFPVPVVAAINGHALGGGCEVALACDFRIMAEEATLRFKQVQMGLVTGWGSGPRLLSLVGYAQAMHLLLLGEEVDAKTALAVGLAHDVAPREQLDERVEAWIRKLMAAPPLAARSVKQLLQKWRGMPLAEAQKLEREHFAALWETEDHWEASRATLEKRRPVFKGR
ncbi:MAG: hypothetical protein BAA01_00410 [Bacillus thermozeamaize]|uniref:Ethylmalonyl-CoA decarboxylase n=1 Tax=Bacillus thermozeamaize TaxID=230954 RepID=A0A1Y3PXU8_9BACI|nr:MAG: hypothetical protein BAA01_00410 [Bacillus thermozeamaize]